MSLFKDFGFMNSIEKTLKELKIFKPTEIQEITIPLIIGGQSVVGISETGSGKTLAYALPIMQLLKTLEADGYPVNEDSKPRAIVVVPTRDLGDQVAKVFKTLTHDTRLRVRTALGGTGLAQSRKNTTGPFEVLIATPGRLVQMIEEDLIHLEDVLTFVLDEADQMMDPGFISDTKKIARACSEDVQMILFTATVTARIEDLMAALFKNAEVCKSSGSGKVVSTLVTKNIMVQDGKRWPDLEKILAKKIEGGTILFTNTREQCDKIAKELEDKGYECAVYRGEMDKNDRRQNLKKFREGKIKLLISTDLAGRGIDIPNVERVINYHLPKQMENYIHRVGRTARAGRAGLVLNLVTERDSRLIGQLEGQKPKSAKNKATAENKVKPSSKDRFKKSQKK